MSLHPVLALRFARLQTACLELGVIIFATERIRTDKRQAELYAQGRSMPGSIVTNAKPGESWHQYGRAVDFAFRRVNADGAVIAGSATWDGPWDMVGAMGEYLGLVWGGRFKKPDRPHFEYHPNYQRDESVSLAESMRRYSEANNA